MSVPTTAFSSCVLRHVIREQATDGGNWLIFGIHAKFCRMCCFVTEYTVICMYATRDLKLCAQRGDMFCYSYEGTMHSHEYPRADFLDESRGKRTLSRRFM